MNESQQRGWRRKFKDAFRGCWIGVRGQSSFSVHLAIASLVVVTAAILRVSFLEWCILSLCIAVVLTAEMFNSALEHLGKAIDERHNTHLANALDIASAAVLFAAIGTALVGAAIFLRRVSQLIPWP